MKKILLIVTFLFFVAFFCFVGLTYYSGYNTISMTVFSVISLSGFALSYSNFTMVRMNKSNWVILLLSSVIFVSTFFSFYSLNWFEMSWNYNLGCHVFILCFALYRGLPRVNNWLLKGFKLILVVFAIILIALLVLKSNNNMIFRLFTPISLILFIVLIVVQLFTKKHTK